MADPSDETPLPQAVVARPKRRRISIVWIIPVIAALVAIGIAVQRIRSEGPTITIVFHSAEGIEAGKSFIKYKDVNIGQVRAVRLTEDFTQVEVVAKISKRAAGLMVEDAKFWVVRPTISLSGVSGLNTLLSGNYIGFEAGKSENDATDFVGLDSAPINAAGQDGREFILKADDLGSLATGSPIYYHRLPVGQIIAYNLAPDGKSVDVRVFINAPYDKYVTRATRFWKASGIDVVLDANGVEVRTESLTTLLVGGLAFDSAPLAADSSAAPPESVFTLFPDRTSALKERDQSLPRYVLYFDESLRGLSVGAPVTFLGVPAGEVTELALALDSATGNVRPRVTIAFAPERVVTINGQGNARKLGGDERARRAFLQRLVEQRGLRAQLRSGNLLTGQLYVAFEYFPRATKVAVKWNGDTTELPVTPGSLSDLEAKLTSILDKVDRLPLDAIVKDVRKDLASLDETLADARKLLRSADSEIVPTLKADLQGLQAMLTKLERVIDNADATLFGPDAPAQQELRDALAEFTRAARSIRVLLDYLERHPESPIRGKVGATMGGK